MAADSKIMVIKRTTRGNRTIIPEETHNWTEFVYYVNCEGTLILDGKEYDIKPGRFVTIKPQTPHSEIHTQNGNVFFCIFETEHELENRVFDDDSEKRILSICDAMISEDTRHMMYGEELKALLLDELLLRLLRWEAEHSARIGDLAWAADVIQRGARDKLDLKGLAADIGFGYDYFHHRFRDKFGCSPKQFQMQCRIDRAKELLETGLYSCTEVAYLAGFSDSAQFSKIFKQYEKISPKHWRSSREKI